MACLRKKRKYPFDPKQKLMRNCWTMNLSLSSMRSWTNWNWMMNSKKNWTNWNWMMNSKKNWTTSCLTTPVRCS